MTPLRPRLAPEAIARATCYRVRAIGRLWERDPKTYVPFRVAEEKTVNGMVPTMLSGQTDATYIRSVHFRDWSEVDDFEVIKIETASVTFPVRGDQVVPALMVDHASAAVRRTITDVRRTTMRAWADPASPERFTDLTNEGEL